MLECNSRSNKIQQQQPTEISTEEENIKLVLDCQWPLANEEVAQTITQPCNYNNKH